MKHKKYRGGIAVHKNTLHIISATALTLEYYCISYNIPHNNILRINTKLMKQHCYKDVMI